MAADPRKKGKRRTILEIVATDRTFERAEIRGRAGWVGKCIHCRSAITVDDQGEPIGPATIEHIVPRNHGGTDDVENLALACARCNSLKGIRHDARRADDPRRLELVEKLQAQRRERWREPLPEITEALDRPSVWGSERRRR
ncbi:HNH endonuclease [Polyangium aurulentum]|uniref:HNH endonuclease n=1 Tax=Polyangium aurulentum TaxID=2567896 RepID=UPI0010ADDE87|nr:HNH endonuclease signature motif containing protein [Polyangium aurulentum]UQA55219.1 HNH endonuclease [Polyangium aurulentum]